MFLKHPLLRLFVPLLLVALLAVACGSTTTGSAAPTATSAPSATPTVAATTPTSTSAVTIMTTSATVDGKSVTILTDAQGRTLYYKKGDTPTSSTCTGGCASAWPPLLVNGSSAPSSSTTLPGQLSAVMTANGQQVEYQGHLLYTFASDTAAGQTSGEGVGGVWFVVTTDLASAGGSTGGAIPTPTTSSGY